MLEATNSQQDDALTHLSVAKATRYMQAITTTGLDSDL
jgi:hypothetical protein